MVQAPPRWAAAALALALMASSCTLTRSDPGFPERRDAVISVFEDDLSESEMQFEKLARPLSRSPATEDTRYLHAEAQRVRESIAGARKALRVYRRAESKEEANGQALLQQLSKLRSEVTEFSRLATFALPVTG